MSMTHWLSASLALVSVMAGAAESSPAPAAQERERFERLVRPYLDGGWVRGLVLGLVDESGTRIYGYGQVSEKGGAPDGKTVYEIGSVTKAFTGILLAEMIGRCEVGLDDPVSKYLPSRVIVPACEGTEITLRHLATHTSALPSLPDNFQPKDPGNPYADYTVEQMYAFLSGVKLKRRPGQQYDYSNLGAGLLGHVLGLRAGKPYEALLRERVCDPLELRETRITLDAELRRHLAPGYDADNLPVANWDIPTLAGAGALRSTAVDVCWLVHAALGLRKTPLEAALREAQTPKFKNQLGLGWHLDPARKEVWHNGQTGGYHSYVGYVPERKLGVVVLSNTAALQVDDLGLAALRLLKGETVAPPKLPPVLSLDAQRLEEYVGEYRLAPQFTISVTREGSRLFARATGQERAGIYPEKADRFRYRVVEAALVFQRDASGRITGLTLEQDGRKLPCPRVTGAKKPEGQPE